MASNAVAGVGAQFRRWDADATSAAGAWVAIAEVTAISGPDKSRETIDVTSLDSTDGYREFIAGFRDAGSVSLSMNFTRDTYETMNADFESDTKINYEIVLPDADNTSLEFAGMVTELPLEITGDDRITADVTIKISGKVTLNSGSGSGV